MFQAFQRSVDKNFSVVITLTSILIIITPFCGWLFNCGCTWPWAGLDSHCNIHTASQQHQCPWCVSLVFGYLLTTISAVISAVVAWHGSNLLPSRFYRSVTSIKGISQLCLIAINIFLGLSVFIVLALLNAWLAAKITNYPYFITEYHVPYTHLTSYSMT